ncbi:GvpL/GvpF family gas vesicle protein [Trichothermofontia sp.]
MYVYALLWAAAQPLTLPPGLQAPLVVVEAGALAAIAEPGLTADRLPTEEAALIQAVLHHDRVVCELFQQTPLLPLRFGRCFVSEASLKQYLQTQAPVHLQQLDALAGLAEYTLKLVPLPLLTNEPELPSSSRGRQYFLAKKQRYQTLQQQQTQQQMERQALLRAIAQTFPRVLPDSEAETANTLHFLASRDPADWQALWQDWQALCLHWQLTYQGPLPPYHFLKPTALIN